MLFFLILITVTAICTYLTLSMNYRYWRIRKVPTPPVSILFGNLTESLTFKKSLGQIYHEFYQNFPHLKYLGFYKMRTPGILLRDPELVKNVLIKDFNSFQANDLKINEDNDPLVAKNPFFIHGDKWRVNRNLLSPSFTTKQVKSLYPLMEVVCGRLVKFIAENDHGKDGIEAKDLSQKFTMDVVASCAVGLEANSFVNAHSEFKKMAESILSPSFFTNIKLFCQFAVPQIATFLKIKFVPDDAGNYFRNVVSETMAYRKEHKITRFDFLDMMQELKRTLGEDTFSNEDITIHLIGFFMDGFETSSVVLSHALYEIAANPLYQEKIKQEIDDTLERQGGKFTFQSVQEMPYLNQFLNESLRMHPADMFLGKLCTEYYTLPSPDGKGPELTIEPNTPVIIPIHSLHYDPQYFPDPYKFDPDRFSPENKNSIVKGTYLPFSDGPRTCLGQRFALGQIKAAIVHLLVNFEIRVNKKTIQPLQIDPTSTLVAAKGGIWLDFYKRQNVDEAAA